MQVDTGGAPALGEGLAQPLGSWLSLLQTRRLEESCAEHGKDRAQPQRHVRLEGQAGGLPGSCEPCETILHIDSLQM